MEARPARKRRGTKIKWIPVSKPPDELGHICETGCEYRLASDYVLLLVPSRGSMRTFDYRVTIGYLVRTYHQYCPDEITFEERESQRELEPSHWAPMPLDINGDQTNPFFGGEEEDCDDGS